MTNRNKQNYRFRTWKFRDRCHLKGGVRQGCFLSLILNYLIQYRHFHSLYIMSHYYAKFKENPCVGTDASTPFAKLYPCHGEINSIAHWALPKQVTTKLLQMCHCANVQLCSMSCVSSSSVYHSTTSSIHRP